MTSVSAGHIIQTPTQPVGSGRPERESNPGPPHQESRALPRSYRGATAAPPPPPREKAERQIQRERERKTERQRQTDRYIERVERERKRQIETDRQTDT